MSDLVKRLRALTAKQIEDNLDYILEADKLSLEAAAEIVRLTAERDAALAKLAQYEQAPVVGWKLVHPLLYSRFSMHPITDGDRSIGWVDTALIARPEASK